MALTKEFLKQCNAIMGTSGNYFVLAEIDRTVPTLWEVGEIIYVSTSVEKTACSGPKRSALKITPDIIGSANEEMAAVLDEYLITSSSTEAVKYTCEDNSEITLSQASSDTSRILFCHAVFGTSNGKRMSYSGLVNLVTDGSGDITTASNSAQRRAISVIFVEAPVKCNYPARNNNEFYPQLPATDAAAVVNPKYAVATTNDSTRLPYVGFVNANSYSAIEQWLGAV